MASLLVKRVASNLSRVRNISPSSRSVSTKGFQFVQHDIKDKCILKCEDSLLSSVACGVVKDAFSPHASLTGNLACLFNVSDLRIGYGTHVLLPRWSVMEDEKALYILRDTTAQDIEDVRESVKEFMAENYEEDLNEPIRFSEEEHVSEDVKEISKKYDPWKRDVFPIINFMRGGEYAPTGEYYYQVLKDDKEVKQFVESFDGSPDIVDGNMNASLKMYAVPYKPQAVYILAELGNPQTRNPYGGYAMEIFLDNSLYNVCDMKVDFTGFKLFIPKKKLEGTKTLGGNLIFFQEKKFFKPTRWQPK